MKLRLVRGVNKIKNGAREEGERKLSGYKRLPHGVYPKQILQYSRVV